MYAELPFTQHAFDILGSARAAHAAVAVEQFLAEIYATQMSTGHGYDANADTAAKRHFPIVG